LELKSYDWWPNIFLYSVTLSFGVTFGARRVQLTITNPTDIERVNDMVENFFTMNGTRVKKNMKARRFLSLSKALIDYSIIGLKRSWYVLTKRKIS
jgi:hypothetical protein